MRRNGEAAALMNDFADLARRFAFEVREGRPDAEEMAFRRGDFDSGNDEKIIDRQAVFAHQTLLEEIGDGVTGVVIGDRESMQSLLARRGDVLLRARNAVARKERVGMEIDV